MDARDTPQIIEHISESVNYTPRGCKWIPCTAKFVTVGGSSKGNGVINIYELEKNALTTLSSASVPRGLMCATFGAASFADRHLATGDEQGYLNIWDLNDTSTPVYEVKAHDSMINCIDGVGGLNIGHGAPELVTGSRDGTVRIWDPRESEYVAAIEPAEGQNARDCWAVAFGNSFNEDERMVAAGYDNGDIKILDLRMNRLIFETNVLNGVVDLEFDRKDIQANKLLATCLEQKFRVYDMRQYHEKEGYAFLNERAHKSTVWKGKHLPQNREIFVTCGGNGSVNLWKYNYPNARTQKLEDGSVRGVAGNVTCLNEKTIAHQPIVGWDWHADKTGLACLCSLDQTVKVAVITKLNQY